MTNHAPRADYLFTITALCTPPEDMGRVNGGVGRMIPITGGSVEGPRLSGSVMPGADWFVMRDDGAAVVEARYAIRANDGAIIQVFNSATAPIGDDAAAPGPVSMITAPRFIAPEGPYGWLNRGVYVGALMPDIRPDVFAVRIAIYRMVPA